MGAPKLGPEPREEGKGREKRSEKKGGEMN